jgi:hypothetical protein
MNPETPANTEQQVGDLVGTMLDNNPDLVNQVVALPAQAIAQVQQQLQVAVPVPVVAPPPAVDAALFQQLRGYVLNQLGTNGLTSGQKRDLTELATRYNGHDLQHVLANAKSLAFDISAWRSHAARQQAVVARATGATLAALSGIDDITVLRGEVSMGNSAIGDTKRLILWTSQLGGCVGVAIHNAAAAFLAHFTPDQLKPEGHPSILDNTVLGITQMINVAGASLSMCSPSRGAPFYNDLRQRLVNLGANVVGEYSSPTFAVRVSDGAVFENFPAP